MGKVNKYNIGDKSTRTIDGITFDSAAEMSRWCELKMLEKSGVISNLERQPRFTLIEKRGKVKHKREYIADFSYIENKKCVIEDVKGVKTAVYTLKRDLFLSLYGEYYIFREYQNGREKDY
jgi:Fe2+ transport system protein B